MSTTILAFHRLGGEGSHRVGSGVAAEPPRLLVERHGSLPIDRLREEVARFGFGIELGAGAQRRLGMRIYAEPPSAG